MLQNYFRDFWKDDNELVCTPTQFWVKMLHANSKKYTFNNQYMGKFLIVPVGFLVITLWTEGWYSHTSGIYRSAALIGAWHGFVKKFASITGAFLSILSPIMGTSWDIFTFSWGTKSPFSFKMTLIYPHYQCFFPQILLLWWVMAFMRFAGNDFCVMDCTSMAISQPSNPTGLMLI